jgi:hypothetical protein
MGHLTLSRDHLWMRLDATTLTGRFLAIGAALYRSAEPDHRLPWFPVPEVEDRSSPFSISLCMSDV